MMYYDEIKQHTRHTRHGLDPDSIWLVVNFTTYITFNQLFIKLAAVLKWYNFDSILIHCDFSNYDINETFFPYFYTGRLHE